MNDGSNDSQLLDRRLAETFQAAYDDPRWAGSTWTDPLTRLDRAHRTSRRRVATASTLGVAVLAAGAVGAAIAVHQPSSDQLRLGSLSAGGASSGSGLDWLLTRDAYRSYQQAHPRPSGGPEMVTSPAARDAALAELEAELQAVLPAGTQVLRDDAAAGGAKGYAEAVLRLPDGTPVEVERHKLDYPVPLTLYTGPGTPDPGMADEQFSDPRTWADGSAYSVVTGTSQGYSLPPGEGSGWDGPFVYSATADGWFTEITAPVGTDQLLGWAQAIDHLFTTGAG